MDMSVFFEIHAGLHRESPGGDEYTRQAWERLSVPPNPTILDLGCGPGAHTLRLAQLSDGTITAIDTHQPYVDRLNAAASAAGLSDRITALNQSMDDLTFPEQSVDVIWSEGAIYNIGFEAGLTQWRSLLKPQGYLVVSELAWLQPDPPAPVKDFWDEGYPGMKPIEDLPPIIDRCGYQLRHQFTLPEAAWWNYYGPVEAKVEELRSRYANHPDAIATLDSEQQEIDLYRNYSDWYGYVFFILQPKC
jgi:SAM-dependent methyltransferase